MNEDDIILGTLVDEIDEEDMSQTEVNREILSQYDADLLYVCVSNKVSETSLRYHIDSAKEYDNMFWAAILAETIRYYSLNPLKMFIFTSFHLSDYSGAIADLLLYVKISIPDMILDKTIKMSMTLDEFIAATESAPLLLKWCMKFIDDESYKKFIAVIYAEYDKPEVEV